MKKISLVLLATLALAAGGFAVWNGSVYPSLGLSGFAKNDYQAAWETAAKGFCASSRLACEGPLPAATFRPMEFSDGAQVWGVARARTYDNRERLAWISLAWSSGAKRWRRAELLVLAGDSDEMYFTPTFPSQTSRAALSLSRLMREAARRVQEYRDWPAK